MKIAELLDASVARASRVAAPWMGVLWLAVLPARLLFVYLLQEITRLDRPQEYSRYLIRIALLQFAAELLALYGRAAYVRACYMNDDPKHGAGWTPLRVPFSDLLTYLYVSFILSFAYYASLMSFIGPACILVLSGLAAASSYGLGKDGLFGSFVSVFGLLRHFLAVLAISLLFAFSLFLANINVLVLINILLWLSAPLLGPSLPRWEHIFEATKPIGAFAEHPLTFSLIAMLAAMLVEPFWLSANVELVQRARVRKTGDDLRQWFNDLRKSELGTQPVRLNRKSPQNGGVAQKATLVTVLFLSTFSIARGSEISVEEYREKLIGINAALDSKDLQRAQGEAKSIDGAVVNGPNGRFKADSSILQPLIGAKDLKSAEPLHSRVRAMAEALSQKSPVTRDAHRVQSDLIEQIRKDQEVPLPPKDGEMDDYGVSKWSVWKWIGDRIVEFFTWLGNKWDAFWKWIGSIFPTPPPGAMNALPEVVKWAAIILAAVAIVVIARMIMLNRKTKPVAVAGSSSPAAQERDANPLSRDASEWELYAERLAKSGRYREAIRAWYHAALVTLFRAGQLHFRKGRTNWEYCFALPPSLSDRERFHDLTRVFEAEWYGSEQSQPERVVVCAELAKGVISAAARTGALG